MVLLLVLPAGSAATTGREATCGQRGRPPLNEGHEHHAGEQAEPRGHGRRRPRAVGREEPTGEHRADDAGRRVDRLAHAEEHTDATGRRLQAEERRQDRARRCATCQAKRSQPAGWRRERSQLILPTAPGTSNEGGSSPLLVPLPAVSWPWVPAWGSLEPPRRDGENAQKTRKNGEKTGEIRPKKCEGRELTKDQLAVRDRPLHDQLRE